MADRCEEGFLARRAELGDLHEPTKKDLRI